MKTSIIISIALILTSLCSYSKADAFVEVGKSEYNTPLDTLWYQEGFPHHFDHSDVFFRVGYEWSGFRASYFNLGSYSRYAIATQDEAKYKEGLCPNNCKRPDVYLSSGDTQGLLFSYVARYKFVFVELGASWSKQTFTAHAYPLYPESQYVPIGQAHYSGEQKGLGYMYSIGVQYRDFTFSYGVFNNGDSASFNEGVFPSGADEVKTLAIGYRF